MNRAEGKGLVQTFDANNNLTGKQDEEGRIMTYAYNSADDRVSMTEGLKGDWANPVSGRTTRSSRVALD